MVDVGTAINGLTSMVFLVLIVLLPLSLTVTMFVIRQSMLGFPCGVFWFLAGAYCYSISTHLWSDPYYWLFFMFTLGMSLFNILAAFALRKSDIPDFAPGPPPDDTSEAVGGEPSRREDRRETSRDTLGDVFNTDSQAQAVSERSTEKRRVRVVPDRRPRRLRW